MCSCVGCSQWTNNACESINHVLKQRQQWRRSVLPDLIENLRSLTSSEYAEADHAICGRKISVYVPVGRNLASLLLTGRRCQSRSGSESDMLCSRCQVQALLERSYQHPLMAT